MKRVSGGFLRVSFNRLFVMYCTFVGTFPAGAGSFDEEEEEEEVVVVGGGGVEEEEAAAGSGMKED